MKIERFEDIESWQLARTLTNEVYRLWKQLPRRIDWTLQDQMVRASTSAMHNIAEGFDAGTNPEFVRFLQMAKRSCTEIQSQLYVALDQAYINPERFHQLYEHARLTRAKIWALIKYLRSAKP